jgi:hypothetical protein
MQILSIDKKVEKRFTSLIECGIVFQHGADNGAIHATVTATTAAVATAAAATTAGSLLTLSESCQDATAGIQLTTHITEVSTSVTSIYSMASV